MQQIFNHNRIYQSKPSPPPKFQVVAIKAWIVNFLQFLSLIILIFIIIKSIIYTATYQEPTPVFNQKLPTLTEKKVSCDTETPKPAFCK